MCWRQATTTMFISAWRRPTDWLTGRSLSHWLLATVPSLHPTVAYTQPELCLHVIWHDALSLRIIINIFFFVIHPITPGNLPANPRLRTSVLDESWGFSILQGCNIYQTFLRVISERSNTSHFPGQNKDRSISHNDDTRRMMYRELTDS